MKTASLFAREQYRLSRLQVYNWRTFSGLHDIPISERGYLIIGGNACGKSTLLDAITALLIPPRLVNFNAAAREEERGKGERSLASYIRGAWSEQKDHDSGDFATQYLRRGTTWSALAVTYRNASNRHITLAQLLWLRGNNNQPSRYHFILERPFDLREFEPFGQTNLDLRKLKATLPDAHSYEDYRPYSERFCRELGIEGEMALRLLHKTQSTKNLGDLNTFLRDFMLDKPETYDVAARLTNEFAELDAAHQAVVTAREQVQTLAPAREHHDAREKHLAARVALTALRAQLDAYGENRRHELLQQQQTTLRTRLDGQAGEKTRCQNNYKHQQRLLDDLRLAHLQAGGNQIAQWEAELADQENQRRERYQKQQQAAAACQALDWSLPDAPQPFAELQERATAALDAQNNEQEKQREQQIALAVTYKETATAFATIRQEIEAMQRQPSNIPATMLELRARITTALGLHESALPFAGELIEVKNEESAWQGAIERLLHGFALSLLVSERHYPALAQHLNQTPLGQRLVYHRVHDGERPPTRALAPNPLLYKLNLKPRTWHDWLQAELRQRYNYTCADNLQTFKNSERALTREGQIKHDRSRHEKDDRYPIDDRRRWILGFDNREKNRLYQEQAQQLADTLARLDADNQRYKNEEKTQNTRRRYYQYLADLRWQDIDLAPLTQRIDQLQQQITRARSQNQDLQTLGEQIAAQETRVAAADSARQNAELACQKTHDQIQQNEQTLQTLAARHSTPPDSAVQNALAARYAQHSSTLTLANLDSTSNHAERALNDEINQHSETINQHEKYIEARLADYKRQWPADSGDLDTSLASAPEYLEKLRRLETDGLPAHEQHFFDLLQKQSHQNLAALATYLADARNAIHERMELVNASLSQVPFNHSDGQPSYLHIHTSDRPLPEVKTFRDDLNQALEDAWSDNRDNAEQRYQALHRLVERLAAKDPENKRWRDAVLDVRQHVEFYGRELNAVGEEIDSYRSGSQRSGGQRQKLSAACLAAALRYQLGGNDYGAPMYAPVIIDEAFDKADNEYTALAMNIFANFGFQMIIATPLKSVMTLEPYIGGACFVTIKDRRDSAVLLIEYDDDQQRLQLDAQARAETETD